ncbi:hypothetical protein, partial [Enterobacter cloacae complex sp. 4DZ3-17B2]|uniref:hypothetical protein n=1 Tax=Enterobacter cloacae complex sp. 4DZ3-17B2 TaxID=2511990 RepID=UPI001CA5B7C5
MSCHWLIRGTALDPPKSLTESSSRRVRAVVVSQLKEKINKVGQSACARPRIAKLKCGWEKHPDKYKKDRRLTPDLHR